MSDSAKPRPVEERIARLRAHIHTAIVDSGKSVKQIAAEVGLSPQEASDCFAGRADLPVTVLLRLAEMAGKPLWWFFDEPPQGISLESAEVALQNVSRIRLYLDALESEFRNVKGAQWTSSLVPPPTLEGERKTGEVVDFSPYLARARAILEREVSEDDSGDVSEESVEMVAHGLYSAETGRALLPRLLTSTSSED